jgi:hypothetical protein
MHQYAWTYENEAIILRVLQVPAVIFFEAARCGPHAGEAIQKWFFFKAQHQLRADTLLAGELH